MTDVNVSQNNPPPASNGGGGSGVILGVVLVVVLLLVAWLVFGRGGFSTNKTSKVDVKIEAPAGGSSGGGATKSP